MLECHPVGYRPMGNDTAVTFYQEWVFLCRCFMHIKVIISVIFKTFTVTANWGLAYNVHIHTT